MGKSVISEDQGFNINIGGHERGSPPGGYYAPWKNPKLVAKHDGEYLTERLTDETISFIDSQRMQDKPFFAYLPVLQRTHTYSACRNGLLSTKRSSKELEGDTPIIEERNARSRGRRDNAELASMVACLMIVLAEFAQARCMGSQRQHRSNLFL